MKNIILIVLFSFIMLVSFLCAQNKYSETGYRNINVSPDDSKLIFSHDDYQGVFLTDFNTNKTIQIADNKNSAVNASFSSDGKYILFKQFEHGKNEYLQIPALYNIHDGKIENLAESSLRCGTPSVSKDGKVIYTINKNLYVSDLDGNVEKILRLSNYANLTPVSPNGKFIIYNDKLDRLWLLNLVTEEKKLLTNADNGYFSPVWAPDNRHVAAITMSGNIVIIDINTNVIQPIGRGEHPCWTNNGEWLIFSKAEILESRDVLSKNIFAVSSNGKTYEQLTSTDDLEAYPVITENFVYWVEQKSNELKKTPFRFEKKSFIINKPGTLEIELYFPLRTSKIQNTINPVNDVYFDIPYVNQRYDTPDWFNGNWACGATSAIQCISYYGLVKQWPVRVSSPYAHISDYGNYICEIYTYNGFTFNIGGQDPNGTIGYGGYGYIIQNNWANTKEYMKQYAQLHGLGSGVDWSPTRNELANEIFNEHPFVLLNSLTTSGHYISVIGYVDIDTTTIIVNDPYGDKNRGYANFYGRRAHYDWPGYNNGYENLNTVWCFIYFRGDHPSDIAIQNFTVQNDTSAVGEKIFVTSEIANIGKQTSVSSTIEIFLSENGIHDENALILGTYNLPGLHVSQTYFLRDSISLPDSIVSDRYVLSIFADADTLNSEMLKDNNVKSENIVLNGYPWIYDILPENSSTVSTPRPEIHAKSQDKISNIDSANVRLYVDGVDVTNLSWKALRKITYFPTEDLTEGEHSVRVEIPNNYGLTAKQNWSFTVELPSGLREVDPNIPISNSLSQNYPNPFNPTTTIEFFLKHSGKVTITIFDATGKRIRQLTANEYFNAGKNEIVFNANSLASGVYFYKLESAEFTDIKKMLLLH